MLLTDCHRQLLSVSSHLHKGMESKKFTCTQCEKSYNQKYNLMRHIEEKHTPDKASTHRNRFKCDLCEYNCDERHKARHIKTKHGKTVKKLKEKPACAQCGITFYCKSNLNKHLVRFHSRKTLAEAICKETITESESDASENWTFLGADIPSESESDSEGVLNRICCISRKPADHGDIGDTSEDIVNQDQNLHELSVEGEKGAKTRHMMIESGRSESGGVDEDITQERGEGRTHEGNRKESGKDNDSDIVFEKKLKMLERATRACRLTAKAVDNLNWGANKQRTWKEEMELLKKRFQGETKADESSGDEKDTFLKALNLKGCAKC